MDATVPRDAARWVLSMRELPTGLGVAAATSSPGTRSGCPDVTVMWPALEMGRQSAEGSRIDSAATMSNKKVVDETILHELVFFAYTTTISTTVLCM